MFLFFYQVVLIFSFIKSTFDIGPNEVRSETHLLAKQTHKSIRAMKKARDFLTNFCLGFKLYLKGKFG